MSRNDAAPLPGATRSLVATSLKRQHVGLEFVGFGVLQQIVLRREKIWLCFPDGFNIWVDDDYRLYYYVDEHAKAKRSVPGATD